MFVTLADVEAAAERIADVARPAALSHSHNLSQLAGREVWLAHEERQRTGSFKIRGAANFMARLDGDVVGVVAASAGNHAQGVALAARARGIAATIHMPASTPLPKIAATHGYGAEVRLVDGDMVATFAAAARHGAEAGLVMVPPFDHPDVIAGQGTLGLELAAALPPAVDTVVVPVGGGGLISGIAAALAATRPDAKVVGVEADAMPAMAVSRRAGHPTVVPTASTMADGIAVPAPSELTLAHVQAHVDELVAVDDAALARAVVLLLERTKSLVEPAGAASLAAVLDGVVPDDGPVCCVLSGGNVDPLLLTKLVERGLAAAGRYLEVRVVLPDRPGELARLSALLADEGLNVLQVEHHRTGADLPVDAAEVHLTLETRDPDHAADVHERLRANGFELRP